MLAVTGNERLPSVPDVPTLQELGYKDYYMVNWTAAFAPANLPQDIQEKLSAVLVDIYSSDKAREFLQQTNWDPFPGNATDLAQFQLNEIERWSSAAKRANIPKQ